MFNNKVSERNVVMCLKSYIYYMKKLIFIIISGILLTSCFSKDHEVDSIRLNGFSNVPNNTITLCLKESIGYKAYHVKFHTTLNNGGILDVQQTLHGTSGHDKKCFEIYLGTFSGRHTSKEKCELIGEMYMGNVKEMVIKIYDEKGKDLISQRTFKNL